MIKFPCHCGHQFSVSEELAGSVIQCPDCRRLNDVPLLSDLQSIDEQGIYKLDASPVTKDDPNRVQELKHVFTRERFDELGQAIDLRHTPKQQEAITPPTIDPGAPKYDPVTGELIKPIEFKPDPAAKVLPIARRRRRMRYYEGDDAPSPLEVFIIPLRLCKPINLLVMFFILLGQVACHLMMIVIFIGYWLLVPFWFVLQCMIVAHFGNVIDETGPTNRNELPTPLRHLGWHEDTFGPFMRVVSALVICYGPAL